MCIRDRQKAAPRRKPPQLVAPPYNAGGMTPIVSRGVRRNPYALRGFSRPLVAPFIPAVVAGVVPTVARGVPRPIKRIRLSELSRPVIPPPYAITGNTRDCNSALVGVAVVKLYNTATDVMEQVTTSDLNGFYAFAVRDQSNRYLVAYKVGNPDLAGTTLNTIKGK